MKPLVSILIPAYDVEKWIADTIRSAVAQTWEQKEIIIVDDGSTDQTLAIAQQFASESVLVVKQDNRGAAAVRSKALSLGQGDYVQWLDADDLVASDKITRQMDALDMAGHSFLRPGGTSSTSPTGQVHSTCFVAANSLRQSFCGASWNKGCVHASSGVAGQPGTD
jgi:glycosyltransferase involved in cell wall biosynthesis